MNDLARMMFDFKNPTPLANLMMSALFPQINN